MRIFLTLLLFSTFVLASTAEKITSSQSSLKNVSKEEVQLTKKLEEVARNITKERKALSELNSEISKLSDQIKTLQDETKETSSRLKELKEKNAELEKTKQELEERLIRIIAEQFSFYLVMDNNYIESTQSIIGDEVLREVDSLIQKDFKALSQNYLQTNDAIQVHNKDIAVLNDKLKGLHAKEKSYATLQDRQKQTVESLDKESKSYKNRLHRISAQKKELQNTLEKLKIIQREEAEKKEQEAAEEAARAALEKSPLEESAQKVTVRQIGSSYQNSQVKKYSGVKTIAPLDSYDVYQGFGNYVDPIYNIKIFNESVILRSRTPQATVKNVLDGKVVFAKQTSMLNHVVIVENSNGIHTIYAHMYQIAPTISVGKKVRKGYILGRIEQDLTFEVTQKNYHINPMELITLQ